MRKEFELTEEQLNKLLGAGKAVPAMYLSGGAPMFGTPQENSNRAWSELGDELGFEYMTVQPVSGKSDGFFTADMKGPAK